jgi:hypothetical protein
MIFSGAWGKMIHEKDLKLKKFRDTVPLCHVQYAPRPNPIKNMVYPYAGVDYNLTLMSSPESTPTHLPRATLCQSRLYPQVKDFGFSLRSSPVPYLLSYLFYK